ncbi:MAG TPA: GYD domain-containing protein [bacterium]|jgi:uncharacterized protein with GYD domain
MGTYLILLTWTEQGVRSAKDTTKREQAFRAQAEKLGAKVRESWWTMGPYDAFAVIDAPDNATASKLALWMGSQGNVKTLTLPCYSAREIDQVVSS